MKDAKGHWVEFLEIKEELWKKSIQETLNRIPKLLESAEKLLDNGGNEAICSGLYTYAVEEYGKVLLLKQCSPSDGKVKIKYKNGFLNHDEKFKVAAEALPEECKILSSGLWDSAIWDVDIFDTERVVADFEARMAIFYCDFLDSGDDIKPVPQVDKARLKKAINKLRLKALGT